MAVPSAPKGDKNVATVDSETKEIKKHDQSCRKIPNRAPPKVVTYCGNIPKEGNQNIVTEELKTKDIVGDVQSCDKTENEALLKILINIENVSKEEDKNFVAVDTGTKIITEDVQNCSGLANEVAPDPLFAGFENIPKKEDKNVVIVDSETTIVSENTQNSNEIENEVISHPVTDFENILKEEDKNVVIVDSETNIISENLQSCNETENEDISNPLTDFENIPKEDKNIGNQESNTEVIIADNTPELPTENVTTLNLGYLDRFNQIKMTLSDDDICSYRYYVEVSEDGKTWTRVIDYTNYDCFSHQNLFFETVVAQYIRVVGTERKISLSSTLKVINRVVNLPLIKDKIICPYENVATVNCGVNVYIDGAQKGDLRENLQDQSLISHKIGGGSLIVQLGQPYLISKIQFKLERHYSYLVETASQWNQWEIAIDQREHENGSKIIEFKERVVVYIKITGTQSHRNYSNWFSITDLRVSNDQ